VCAACTASKPSSTSTSHSFVILQMNTLKTFNSLSSCTCSCFKRILQL